MSTGADDFSLMRMWAEADKKSEDWRESGDIKLIEQMHDAYRGLEACGWNPIAYCPKDGSRFLAIEAGPDTVAIGNLRVWAEAHGDLWPAWPVLWKPMP